MPRIDSSLHSYGQSGADATTNVPANTNTKTTEPSPSTTVKSSLSDSNSASRDNALGAHLPRMPDTSDDLKRNWLTATATPRFSRADLPNVVMPVRADSRKAKGRPSTAGTTNNNPTTGTSATVSRGGEAVPDRNKTKGIHVAAEEASLTSTSPSPEIVIQNNQHNFTERRHTTEDRRSRRTVTSRDYLDDDDDDDDGKEGQMPFHNSSKLAGGFTKLRRVLSLGGSSSDEPTSSIQLQAHALIDNKDDNEDNTARSEFDALPLGDSSGRSDKRWQLSSIFKFFSGGPNKGSKLT